MMTIGKAQRNIISAASLVAGGVASWLLINVVAEERSGLDVFTGHEDKLYYGIDIASAIVCAGISHCLQSCYNRWQASPVIFSPKLDENWQVIHVAMKLPTPQSGEQSLMSPKSQYIMPPATAPHYQALSSC